MAHALIVDDHALFAEAISRVLQREGHDVVGVVRSGREALGAARRTHPDIVLLDLGLADANGIDVGASILADRPSTKLLAVTARSDRRSVSEAFQAGFHGYVTKDAGLSHLVRSVESVLEGRSVMPRDHGVAGDEDSARREALEIAGRLTPRERDILRLLAQGATTREIAASLHIAGNTVRSHVHALLSKLQVHTRLSAVAFATRYGLVSDATPGQPPANATGGG